MSEAIELDARTTPITGLGSNAGAVVVVESPRHFAGVLCSRITAYDVVRILLGLVLLSAAALKGHQLATSPVAETGLLTSRWFLIALVELELALGLWLMAGVYPVTGRYASIACFAVFGAISLVRALGGEASCGCFGAVSINPWWTASFDIVAAITFVLFKPSSKAPSAWFGFKPALIALFAVGVPAGVLMAGYRPTAINASGDIVGDSRVVVLEPESWLGKPFPLFSHIDVGNRLSAGKWAVLFYHHDCPQCQEVLAVYAKNRTGAKSLDGIETNALVEIPPFALVPRSTAHSVTPLHGRLDATRQWFVAAPLEVHIADGVVVTVKAPASIAAEMRHNTAIGQ